MKFGDSNTGRHRNLAQAMTTSANALLIAAALTVGLSAGLLFAYSVSVNPGLRQLGDDAYIAAMQGINRAIQNGVFFAVYFMPVLLLPLCCRAAYKSGGTSSAFWLLMAAAVLYTIGVVGITIGGNVPLNNALEAFRREGADAAKLRQAREAFEGPWNKWHVVRTWAAVLSFGLVLAAMANGLKKGDS